MNPPEQGAAFIGTPVVHERDLVMEEAGKELLVWANQWGQKHGLSIAEFQFLFGTLVVRHAKAACLYERQAKG